MNERRPGGRSEAIAHWLALIAEMFGLKPMEKVARLKADHGPGHGHANAIVAHVGAKTKA